MKKSLAIFLFSLLLTPLSAQLPDLVLPVGHMGNLNTVTFSNDNQYVLTTSEDGTAKVWDARRGKLLYNLMGHTDDVFSGVFSPGGENAVTLSRDGSVKTWDMLTGEILHSSLSPVTIGQRLATISPDGRFVLSFVENNSGDNTRGDVCLWDTRNENWSELLRIPGTYVSWQNPFAFSPDLKSFLFLSEDEFPEIADFRTGKVLHRFEKTDDRLYSAGFSADGKYLLTCTEESIKIFDVEKAALKYEIKGSMMVFSTDKKKIAILSPGNAVLIYDIATGKILRQMGPDNSTEGITGLQFSPDDTRLLVSFGDATLRLFDIRENKMLFVIEGGGPVAFSPNGKIIIAAANGSLGFWSPSLDQVPKLWDGSTGKLLYRLEGHTKYVTSAKFSPDGKKIVCDSWDPSARIWDIKNGKMVRLKGDILRFNDVSFSPDGSSILAYASNETAFLWDAETAKELFSMKGNTFVDEPRYGLEFKARFSPDSKLVATSYPSDTFVRIYDIGSRQLKYELASPVSVSLAVFNHGGSELAIASGDNKARIWDMATGSLKSILDDVENTSTSEELPTILPAQFSPDGRIVITFPPEGLAEGWDAVTGSLLYNLPGKPVFPKNPFSSDSKRFVTFSETDTAGLITTLWDTQTGRPIRSFNGGILSDKPISRDNSKLITGSDEKDPYSSSFLIQVWNINTGSLLCSIHDTIDYTMFAPLTLGFSSDGEKVTAQNDNGDLTIWDIRTGVPAISIKSDAIAPTSLTLCQDGGYFITNNAENASIWDITALKPISNPAWFNPETDNSSALSSFNFSPDGLTILTSSVDGTTKLWDTRTGELVQSFLQTLVGPDGILDPSSGEAMLFNLFGEDGTISKSGCCFIGPFSPDSKKILGNCDGTMMIWDLQKSLWLAAPEEMKGSDYDFQFTPDSKRILAKSEGKVKVWDIESGRHICTLDDSIAGYGAPVLLSNDDSRAAATLANGITCLWNMETGKRINAFDTIPLQPVEVTTNYNTAFNSLAFSPDDKYVLTKDDENLKTWDAGDGKLLYNSAGEYPYQFADSAFSPGNKSFAADYYKISDTYDEPPVLNTEIRAVPSAELKFKLEGISSGLANPFSPDKKNILTKADGKAFNLWDSESGKLKFSFGWDEPGRIAGSAFFSPDGKSLLTSSYFANDQGYITRYEPMDLWSTSNGKKMQTINIGSARPGDIDWKDGLVNSIINSKISLYDIKTGKEKAAFVAIDDEDYVFVLPTGEYMGTAGGVIYLSWRLNNKLYDFDQWDLQYNRPDKVLEQLGNPDTSLIRMYHKAYEKRLKKAGFTESMFTSEFHAPESEILNADEFSSPVTDPHKNLKVSFTDTKYKLDRLNVWINDVPVAGKNGISVRDTAVGSLTKEIPLTLSSGLNRIQVSCINEKGAESLKEAVEIIYNPKTEVKPDLYVIAISVSAYKDNRYNLRYAVKDGRDMVAAFKSKIGDQGLFNKIYLDTLFDRNATRENFFTLKQKLMASHVDDQVIVFISGHGLLNKDMDFFFATYDIDFSNPGNRGISFDAMESLLDSIPARKKLMMIDACHSGEVDKEENAEMLASNTETTSDITFRGVIKEYGFKGLDAGTNPSGISLNTSFELMQELFTGIDKGTGTTVISAAAGKGYALESPQWNNGVFTYSIINGLKNKAADTNHDGEVTISELKDYSIKQVTILTGGKQKPTARRESIGCDWRVW